MTLPTTSRLRPTPQQLLQMKVSLDCGKPSRQFCPNNDPRWSIVFVPVVLTLMRSLNTSRAWKQERKHPMMPSCIAVKNSSKLPVLKYLWWSHYATFPLALTWSRSSWGRRHVKLQDWMESLRKLWDRPLVMTHCLSFSWFWRPGPLELNRSNSRAG